MKKNINFTRPGFIAYNLLWIAAVACFYSYGEGMKELYDEAFTRECIECGKFCTADLLLYRLKREGKITDTEWKMYQDELKRYDEDMRKIKKGGDICERKKKT